LAMAPGCDAVYDVIDCQVKLLKHHMVLNNLHKPCPLEKLVVEPLRHPFDCPYVGYECSVTCNIPELVSHLKDDHVLDMHDGYKFNNLYAGTDTLEMENDSWMLSVFNCYEQQFCLHKVAADDTNLAWLGVPRSIRDSHVKVREDLDRLVIPRNLALSFSEGDKQELKLRSLGRSKMEIEALVTLFLTGCSNLENIPEFGQNMKCLENLYVDGTNTKKLPESLGELHNLRKLDASETYAAYIGTPLYGVRLGQPALVTRLQAYMIPPASKSLAKDWPSLIQIVRYSRDFITDVIVHSIAQSCPLLVELKLIDIPTSKTAWSDELSDDGALTNIQNISLTDMAFKDVSKVHRFLVEIHASSVSCFALLSSLNLGGTNVTDALF
ncbi:E3 ubiquitin protein ligase SINAT2, partial [Tanacetum coccineum]